MMLMKYTRDAYLWCISVIYLFAFSSLYVQIPGLYGDNGLLPARLVLDKEANSWQELLEGQPTLLKLTPKLGLDTQTGMDLLCLGGMLISFFCMVSKKARDMVSFTLLWMLYLSLYQAGQTFLWFQWDILLLEAGFLTILVAPFNLQLFRQKSPAYHQHDTITMWLVKWLLFRLMFASGVVKLTSRCPTWWGLTALTHHFESQCIPTAFAWYWHQAPVWFLKLSCVATYVIEIPIPFLFFVPIRSVKIFAFYSQLLLQVMIILTGNYNFFNLLTIALCISLLDDDFFRRSKKGNKKKQSFIWSVLKGLVNLIAQLAVYGFIGYHTWKLFNLKLKPDYTVESKIGFTEREFTQWLEKVMPYTIWLGAVSLGYEIVIAILRSLIEVRGTFKKCISAVQCILFGAAAVGMFTISLVPFTLLHKPTQKSVWRSVTVYQVKTRPFHLTGSYGLFRRMTGVEGRPEVVIEGSDQLDFGWKEYDFLYKPGKLNGRPPIVAPHQPRLDWQMWFAGLGSYQNNPWFLNLIYRLLNNQQEVIELINHNPFPEKPPKYIRATLYHYHYTRNDPKHHSFSESNWWTRKKKVEYLPILHKDEKSFLQYLTHYRILEDIPKTKVSGSIGEIIQWIRRQIGQPEGFQFVMSVFGSGLLINILNCYVF